MHWYRAIAEYAERGVGYVVATVLATSGSAPRPRGSKMIITSTRTDDSIGGGQLEFLVTEQARALLSEGQQTAVVQHYPLAAAATQCCGGSVTVLLECFTPPLLRVAVFGAGHVGRRVVQLLADLQAHIDWFDQRPDIAPEGNVSCRAVPTIAAALEHLSPGQEVLIVTHDHQFDYELVAALLKADFIRIGLIGSATKWQRFSARLRADGFSDAQLQQVTCPVGHPDVTGKQPMAIAVAIVADLLRDNRLPEPDTIALSWRQLKLALVQNQAQSTESGS